MRWYFLCSNFMLILLLSELFPMIRLHFFFNTAIIHFLRHSYTSSTMMVIILNSMYKVILYSLRDIKLKPLLNSILWLNIFILGKSSHPLSWINFYNFKLRSKKSNLTSDNMIVFNVFIHEHYLWTPAMSQHC